jgi:hypothetical protein
MVGAAFTCHLTDSPTYQVLILRVGFSFELSDDVGSDISVRPRIDRLSIDSDEHIAASGAWYRSMWRCGRACVPIRPCAASHYSCTHFCGTGGVAKDVATRPLS